VNGESLLRQAKEDIEGIAGAGGFIWSIGTWSSGHPEWSRGRNLFFRAGKMTLANQRFLDAACS